VIYNTSIVRLPKVPLPTQVLVRAFSAAFLRFLNSFSLFLLAKARRDSDRSWVHREAIKCTYYSVTCYRNETTSKQDDQSRSDQPSWVSA